MIGRSTASFFQVRKRPVSPISQAAVLEKAVSPNTACRLTKVAKATVPQRASISSDCMATDKTVQIIQRPSKIRSQVLAEYRCSPPNAQASDLIIGKNKECDNVNNQSTRSIETASFLLGGKV
jgi:hypothetical protein